jgi:FlaA1/EpsC-like NDP-sugar epimerase
MERPLKSWVAGLRNRYILLVDLVCIVLSVWASFALAVGLRAVLPTYAPAVIWMLALALAIKPVVYYFFGLYRRLWIYASVNEVRIIALAVTMASAIVDSLMLVLFYAGVFRGLPRSALGIDWLISLLLVGGVRFSLRLIAEGGGAAPARPGAARLIVVIGAGDAGALVVRELQKNRQMNLIPLGFLDDDPAKQKGQIYGVPVIGTIPDLAAVLDHRRVDEVIIAIPSAPGRVVRSVSEVCRLKAVPFRTMPGIYELIGGRVNVSRLREVQITDLLRREPVQIQDELVSAALAGKRVLVTGAGGSIGREISRQAARWNPTGVILLGHGENSIFEALLELRDDFPGVPFEPVIADVRDEARLRAVFAQHHPQVVFHAAAHKHVPLMQINTEEAVSNNVFGTANVVGIALESQVERLVLISTDKAVRPANVYGATKRLAEMIVLDAACRTQRAFTVVRFGNVLGSRGSVIPLFKQQIARGGPVLVTHPDMRRYFMTIPEAVHLVLQAASMGQGGEAFLLNMGEQVRILDMAEDLIRLSGLEPGKDIEIVFTGIRPGDKLSEELWEQDKNYEKTSHPDIFRSADEDSVSSGALQQALEQLRSLVEASNTGEIISLLDTVVPGASLRESPATTDLTSVV